MKVTSSAPGWSVAALVTLPPRLAARHSDFQDLTGDAERAGASVIHAANSNSPDVIDTVRNIGPDIVFVIGWSQVCKSDFLKAVGGRAIGYHPTPLPQMRGRAAIPWTILLGRTITGATLFWLDEGIDTGLILAQRFFHVAYDETATTLYQRHLRVLEEMLGDSLAMIASGRAPRIEQDERFASWVSKRSPSDGLINWHQSAADVWCLIRAVTRPYPGAFTVSGDENLVIWSARIWEQGAQYSALPGQIIARQENEFAVSCGDGGALWVSDWETPSGRMPKMHLVLGLK